MRVAAVIVALGLIAGGFLAGGRYEMVSGQANTVVRLDRFTGEVSMCIVGQGKDSCDWEARPKEETITTVIPRGDLPPCDNGAADCDPWERVYPATPPVGTVVPAKGR